MTRGTASFSHQPHDAGEGHAGGGGDDDPDNTVERDSVESGVPPY